MFNANNSNTSQNIWDQMALFNQLTLCNILNGRNNLGTLELRAAVASMSEEQKDDALVFLVVTLRSWLAFPMVEVCKLLQMSAHCWTTFLQLSPTRGVIQLGLLTNLRMSSVQITSQI